MSDSYKIVVGLEVHVQRLTKTKLFCGCPNKFGLDPNSATCPVCLGLPGSLPVMNRKAFELALKAGTALNCKLARYTKWDRKQYYYPDLPKNYQVSQFDLPFCREGWLEVTTDQGTRKIRIHHIHLEEDAGKLIHDESGQGGSSMIDLNRTGTPLLEIVSEPDMQSAEEAKAYLEEIRLIMRDLEVSDCEMQEGSLRCDANVNLHIPLESGTIVATPITEVKNLNSFRAVERAIRYEAERQYEEFQETGNTIKDADKATAGWNDNRGVTVIQRRKEVAADYRYIPDPDLVPVVVDDAWLESIAAEVGELPAVARQRLQDKYGLSDYDAGVITQQGRNFTQYFDALVDTSGDAKESSNWLTNQVLATMNDRKVDIKEFPIDAPRLAGLIAETKKGLNKQRARDVFAHMLDNEGAAGEIMKKLGFEPLRDESKIREIVLKAIAANEKAVNDYKNGKKKAADAIKGRIMKETKGQADMQVLMKVLQEELGKLTAEGS